MPRFSTKAGPQGAGAAFQSHYFPAIPVGYSSIEADSAGLPQQFHRSDFDAGTDLDPPPSTPGDAAAPNPEWERQLEIGKQEAYIRGFAEGEKVGMETGRREVDPLLSSFGQAMMDLDRVRQQMTLRSQEQAAELALCIATKIIGDTIASDPLTALNSVREALRHVIDNERITIKLHPDAARQLESQADRWAEVTEGMENITVTADASVSPGGCLVETNFGDVDARIETQLEQVRELLREEFQLKAVVT